MRHEGFAVEPAATLAGAIGKVERLRPQLILLDAALPDGEGIEVLHYLRARQLRTPVAVVTGSVDPDVLGEYQRAGSAAVFTKPVAPVKLLEWLKLRVSTRAGDNGA